MKKLLLTILMVPVMAFAWEPIKPITVISPVAPGAGNEMSFRAVSSIIERAGKAVGFETRSRAAWLAFE